MIQLIQKYPKSFAAAIGFHLLVFAFFVLSFDWTHKPEPFQPEVDVVQAVAVNEKDVQAELDKLKAIEDAKKKKEDDRVKKLQSDAEKAKREREKEQQRLKQLEKERKKEAERKKRLEQERKREEAEKRRVEKERKRAEAEVRKAEEKRKAAERAAAEERRKAEEARKQAEAERKRAEEAARKAKEEAERKARQEELRKQRAEEARLLREQMLAEEARIKAAAQKARSSAITRHTALVKSRIEGHWNKVGLRKNLSCIVQIRLIPTGDVIGVSFVRPSGDAKFDKSVQDAILRAQPLPMPEDKSLVSEFRNIELEFKNN